MTSDTSTMWFFYLAATLLLAGMLGYFLRRYLSWFTLFFVLGGLSLLFLVPVAVPDTSELAPAWLVALFEWALGRPEAAVAALRPLLVAITLFYLLVFAFLFARKRRH